MNNTSVANQNIVYINYKTSGLASSNAEKSIVPNAISNIIKGRVLLVIPPTLIKDTTNNSNY